MRVRITEPLDGSIDGIQLDRFIVGQIYDVGTSLGCYLLSLKAAAPVADETPALVLPLDQQMFHAKGSYTWPREMAADRPRKSRKLQSRTLFMVPPRDTDDSEVA